MARQSEAKFYHLYCRKLDLHCMTVAHNRIEAIEKAAPQYATKRNIKEHLKDEDLEASRKEEYDIVYDEKNWASEVMNEDSPCEFFY